LQDGIQALGPDATLPPGWQKRISCGGLCLIFASC